MSAQRLFNTLSVWYPLSPMRRIVTTSGFLLLAAVGVGGALVACNGNPAPMKATEGPSAGPAVMRAIAATANPLESDPVSNVVWRNAHWTALSTPDPMRNAAATWVATSYDATNLYVGFICGQPVNEGATAPAVPTAAALKPWQRDSVELWLDSSVPEKQNGSELFRIVVANDGSVYTSWMRSTMPEGITSDPSVQRPMVLLPDYKVPGLKTALGHSTYEGQPVWTAVLAIPLNHLPQPLRNEGAAGKQFHANWVRNNWSVSAGGDPVLVQSDFTANQQIKPLAVTHPMGELVLEPVAALALRGGAADAQ
jgi:hypothetical protein